MRLFHDGGCSRVDLKANLLVEVLLLVGLLLRRRLLVWQPELARRRTAARRRRQCWGRPRPHARARLLVRLARWRRPAIRLHVSKST